MVRRLPTIVTTIYLLLVLLLAACVVPVPLMIEPTQSSASTSPTVDDLGVDALRSAIYTLSDMFEEPVTLEEGSYVGEPDILTVGYVENSIRYGDLDGDGVKDAIVFLMERGGGTAANYHLAVQLNRDGEPVDAGSVLVDSNPKPQKMPELEKNNHGLHELPGLFTGENPGNSCNPWQS